MTPPVEVIISFYTRDSKADQIIEPTTIDHQLLVSNSKTWTHTRHRLARLGISYSRRMVLGKQSHRRPELRNGTRGFDHQLSLYQKPMPSTELTMLIAGSNMLSMKTIMVGIHWCRVIPHTLRHWNATWQGTIWMMTKIFINTSRTGGSYRAQIIYNISENSNTLTTNGVASTCMIQFVCCVRLPLKWMSEEFPIP